MKMNQLLIDEQLNMVTRCDKTVEGTAIWQKCRKFAHKLVKKLCALLLDGIFAWNSRTIVTVFLENSMKFYGIGVICVS